MHITEDRFTSRTPWHDFREICYTIVEQTLREVALNAPSANSGIPEIAMTLRQRRNRISEWLHKSPPGLKAASENIDQFLTGLLSKEVNGDPARVLKAMEKVIQELRVHVPRQGSQSSIAHFALISDTDGLNVLIRPRTIPSGNENGWERMSDEQRFIELVTKVFSKYRHDQKKWLLADLCAFERAVQIASRGNLPALNFQPLQTSFSRRFQTYLSLADPGHGHYSVTVKSQRILRGTIVHIEYIDRGKIQEKSRLEAYRIPSIVDVVRARIAVGDETPCTVYIGRPLFESSTFETDLLKTAHTISAACSAMFQLGVADCKIAMDALTARQAIELMAAVRGNTLRDPYTQRLSAAFNINTPIEDDRDRGHRPVSVTEPQSIAELAVSLAIEGGFEKVTWDGAGDEASTPFIGQLSLLQLFDLVYTAHRHGLETYISAGMDATNMRDAVLTGVGGVGIGTKLHDRDAQSGAIKGLNQKAIEAVLKVREQATLEVAGRAIALLSRLAWLENYSKRRGGSFIELYNEVADSQTRLYEEYRKYLKNGASQVGDLQSAFRSIFKKVTALLHSSGLPSEATGKKAAWIVVEELGQASFMNELKVPLHPALQEVQLHLLAKSRRQGDHLSVSDEVATLRRILVNGDVKAAISYLHSESA